MFKKGFGIFLSVVMLFTFAGCHVGKKPTEGPAAEQTNGVFANSKENFILLRDAVIESTLPPVSYEVDFPTEVSGEGVLYGDKTSSISIKTSGAYAEVTVDGVKTTCYAENFVGANIVDVKKDDNLHELAVYFEGASADPSVTFFHFDGTKLTNITHTVNRENFSYTSEYLYGYLDGDEGDAGPTYGAMWTNQNGVLITSFQQVGFASPRIALGYMTLENDKWVECKAPLNTQKTYSVSTDFKAFFTPMDEAPADYSSIELVQNYNFEGMREFKKGQSIKFLGSGEMHNYYTFYVEIDGEKGVLAFWTGD